ncbi:MAG: hypothetical protein BM555_03740 [Crocinitomix sp. MedPE-SWsnd]|nr:MAG: hypothetical protein BM555_03740 [Crocinitomix sp. MedPE-SWsnd]
MKRLNWTYGLLLVLLSTSCTKSEVNTKNLGKQGRWMVTVLNIGSNTNVQLPTFVFQPSEDPEVLTDGTWIHNDNSQAALRWRFNYYAGTFSILINENVEQDETSKAFVQCNNLSGEYNIITEKKKLFEFESMTTNGYGSIPVFIQIQPA